MTVEADRWSTGIQPPLKLKTLKDIEWDYDSDVIVVGLGGAGVAAALQSLELGQSVIALDRFDGGGATTASGGVLYAGGGTVTQKQAGIHDTPENMFNYLKMETGNIVHDATLMDFCQQSAPTVDWLVHHGVDFRPTLWPKKTSYPAPEYFLYHSDNSLLPQYAAHATPAARGHRGYVPIEQGRKAVNLGGSIFDPLLDSASKKGLKTYIYTEVKRLITNKQGRVIGIQALRFENPETRNNYIALRQRAYKIMQRFPPIIPGSGVFLKRAMKLLAKAEALEGQRQTINIRAHKGVVLSAGGFVFNRKMMQYYAPKYKKGYPLGTDGDNGAGIHLGASVGGMIGNMDRVTAWRFINPPLSFARGLIVNQQGHRFINEMVYGATLGIEIAEKHDGKAWLILDKSLVKEAMSDVKGDKVLAFQRALAKLNANFAAKKSKSIEGLAKKIRVDPTALLKQVSEYNLMAKTGNPDPFQKPRSEIGKIDNPPFYAIDIGLGAKMFPCPTLTLGGLVVDERSGQVLGKGNKPITGLYAAGRNAIGVASRNYVSGLSIADGIYSGRRAARAISSASTKKTKA